MNDKHKPADSDDIPELEEVVEAPAAQDAPPPNFDLFEAGRADLAALRDALVARLHEEIDAMAAELHADVERVMRSRIEESLGERLADVLDAVLGGASQNDKR